MTIKNVKPADPNTNTTTNPKKQYSYLVAYNFENGGGSAIVTRPIKIKNSKDLEGVREYLETLTNCKISISNFILFEE